MARGKLRIYLGAAPGVGKTFAMLDEGWRRHEPGHRRGGRVTSRPTTGPKTAAQIRDLEVVPRAKLTYRGQTFEEMDLDAVLARRPAVALVDELAHTNVPGSRHEKRWEDVEDLLDAGIDVISTVNIQHLVSLNDVVERITGITQRETVPDSVVRAADQIELVDMHPEALRRRMAHGNIYPAEKVDAALAHYFRVGNLGALRELALLWVADRVDDELADYRERHGITEPWETKERVVVALTGAPGGEHLLRRAARMAARVNGELVGVHVRPLDAVQPPTVRRPRRAAPPAGRARRPLRRGHRRRRLRGAGQLRPGRERHPAPARRQRPVSRWAELIHGSVINRVVRDARPIDVHVISAPEPAGRRPPRLAPTPAPRRPCRARRRQIGLGARHRRHRRPRRRPLPAAVVPRAARRPAVPAARGHRRGRRRRGAAGGGRRRHRHAWPATSSSPPPTTRFA